MNSHLWTLEERLWLDGAEAFEELMHPDCVMAFPGAGLLAGPDILASLQGAPRWASVAMEPRRLTSPAEDLAVLAYLADGRREGAEPYRAWCTSTWAKREAGWRLVQHQQTPG